MRPGNNSFSPPPRSNAAPSAPAPSAPAPSAPAPSAPAPSAPAPSAPVKFTPTPSVPVSFAPTPSAPVQFTPAPSAPVPEKAHVTPTPANTPPPAYGALFPTSSDANPVTSIPANTAPPSYDTLFPTSFDTAAAADRAAPSNESGTSEQRSEFEVVRRGVEALQTLVREKIEQRSNITPDKLRQFLLEPIKGGAASDANDSRITGGVVKFPTTQSEIRDFPLQAEESRDEYRRKLETTLADELLSTKNTGYQKSLDLMNAAETSLLEAVLTHKDRKRNEGIKALMPALYGEKPFTNTGLNGHINQFTNGVNQAKAEGNELMLGATRAAGLLQAIAWLGASEDNRAGKIQNKKTNMVYEDHKFFGDGRGRDTADNSRDGTIYKGIVKSENYTTVKDRHKNDQLLTKAQIAHEPEIKLGQKPQPDFDEAGAPAWLTDETARTMPFVNSVSGLGMLSSLSDAMGLLPSDPDEKMQFLALVAAAQLYSVGGHSFHEFMEGVGIGQDAKAWQRPEGIPNNATDKMAFAHDLRNDQLPRADHGFTFEGFVNQLSDEVLNRVIEEMTS